MEALAVVVIVFFVFIWLLIAFDPREPPWRNLTQLRVALPTIAAVALVAQAATVTGPFESFVVLLRLVFVMAIFLWFACEVAFAWRASFGRERQAPHNTVYSVPRRFSLGTLIVITMAFSLLSTVFRWALGESLAILLILGFVAVVGLAQFTFDAAPRQGSMIAGVFFFALPVGLYSMGPLPMSQSYWLSNWAYFAAWWAIGGAVVGYVTGIVVGSLFMILAAVNTVLQRAK